MTWAKIDDQFPDHPKVAAAGPICELIHVRSICYCCRYLTDGFVPDRAVPTLLVRLDRIDIEDGIVGDGTGGRLASFGRSAGEIDWASEMVKYGLWHRRRGGFEVHDFLTYNRSRKDVLEERNGKRRGGEKGAQVTNSKRYKSGSAATHAEPHVEGSSSPPTRPVVHPPIVPPRGDLASPVRVNSTSPITTEGFSKHDPEAQRLCTTSPPFRNEHPYHAHRNPSASSPGCMIPRSE